MVMMNNQSNGQINLAAGTLITGKWNKNQYKIKSLLGNGANGTVYLALSKNGEIALKLSKDSTNITNEVNVLKKITRVQGSFLGPSFIDVDDYIDPYTKESYYFYVMEYVNGVSLPQFIDRNGMEWSSIFIIQLLSLLSKLHDKGYIFGDLKTDNLLVTKEPYKIQWIDFGGVTQMGRAVKEFTEFFDRGYWGLGSRKAEVSYDLFSVSMIFIHLHSKKQFLKNGQGIKQIEQVIYQTPSLKPYKEFLLKGLEGKYTSAEQMKRDLLMHEQKITKRNHQMNKVPKTPNAKTPSVTRSGQSATRTQVKVMQKKKRSHWFETSTIVLLLGLAYALYFYYQL